MFGRRRMFVDVRERDQRGQCGQRFFQLGYISGYRSGVQLVGLIIKFKFENHWERLKFLIVIQYIGIKF
jgi:hypothetical protein